MAGFGAGASVKGEERRSSTQSRKKGISKSVNKHCLARDFEDSIAVTQLCEKKSFLNLGKKDPSFDFCPSWTLPKKSPKRKLSSTTFQLSRFLRNG